MIKIFIKQWKQYSHNETVATYDEETCKIPESYKEGNSIQLVITFFVCVVCAISILVIYILDIREDIPSLTLFRDLMCSSIGFLLRESKIKKKD